MKKLITILLLLSIGCTQHKTKLNQPTMFLTYATLDSSANMGDLTLRAKIYDSALHTHHKSVHKCRFMTGDIDPDKPISSAHYYILDSEGKLIASDTAGKSIGINWGKDTEIIDNKNLDVNEINSSKWYSPNGTIIDGIIDTNNIGQVIEREYYQGGLTYDISHIKWKGISTFTDSVYNSYHYDTSYGYIIFPSADDKGVSFNGHYAMKIDSVWNHRYNAYEVQDATESDQSIDLRKTIKIIYSSIRPGTTMLFDLNNYYIWIPKNEMTKINL